MNKLVIIRDTFREQWAWLLLPILFAICFIVSNRTGVTNLFRLVIVLPMLLCFRVTDIGEIWANTTARWFLFLCGWMTITLFWDGWSDKDVKLLLRELNVLALFYLIFLVCKYHRHRMPLIANYFLLLGVVGALLILKDWQGLQKVQENLHYQESARGVFNHHLEVGWIMAVLTLVALCSWLKSSWVMGDLLYFIALTFFAAVTFLVQARGGYVVLIVGSVAMLLVLPNRKAAYFTVLSLAGLVVTFLVFQQSFLTVVASVTERGASGRLPIWHNGMMAIVESPIKLFFGHGLSASVENVVGDYTAAHYHNFFLNHGFYCGIFGLGLYVCLLYKIIKKAISQPDLWLWAVILFAMQAGFITDGDRLFVNPSAMMLCVLLPLFLVCLGGPRETTSANMDCSRNCN